MRPSDIVSRRTSSSCRAGEGRPVARALVVLCLAGLALAPAGCALFGGPREPAIATVGQPAPDFELNAVPSDEPVRLSSFRGRPVIVNFFCNCRWCYDLAHVWNREREKLGSAEMLAIMHNRDTFNPVRVREFREPTKFDWPVLADLNSRVSLKYNSTDCPVTWVIDSKGIVRHRSKSRTDPAEETVQAALQALAAL